MADKDINIHIRAKGAEDAKRQISGVAQTTGQVGDKAQETGSKSEQGFGKVRHALTALMGPLGFAGLFALLGAGARKVAAFFDDLARRIDEAVRKVKDLRAGYDGLFEAMGAFDERSRRQVVAQSLQMLAETRVSREVGLPVIEAYTRQFRGAMVPDAFDAGLRGMLGYAARHGGSATSDLVMMMAGWGMTDAAQQGAFRRQIAAAAAETGLTDADVIGAMGQGMPTIQAMGWQPQEAVATIAALAAGETGGQRKGLPARTLDALMAPSPSAAEVLALTAEQADDPRAVFAAVQQAAAGLEPQAATRLLQQVYSGAGATGVFKLMRADVAGRRAALARAAGPAGIAAEQAEEAARMETLESRAAGAEAVAAMIEQDITSEEEYRRHIRAIGSFFLDIYSRRRPLRGKVWGWAAKAHPTLTPEELGARMGYYESLPQDAPYAEGVRMRQEWEAASPQEQYERLMDVIPSQVINHYHNNTNLFRSEGGASMRADPE